MVSFTWVRKSLKMHWSRWNSNQLTKQHLPFVAVLWAFELNPSLWPMLHLQQRQPTAGHHDNRLLNQWHDASTSLVPDNGWPSWCTPKNTQMETKWAFFFFLHSKQNEQITVENLMYVNICSFVLVFSFHYFKEKSVYF